MKILFKHTFIGFAVVGGIGFLVDLTSMLLLSNCLPHLIARGIAFWIAASSNWWWNRHITFIDAQPTPTKKAAALQWLQFLGGSMVAFIPNWGCYLVLLKLQASITDQTLALLWPYLAMVPGILIGMGINYVFSRFWVFSQKKTIAKVLLNLSADQSIQQNDLLMSHVLDHDEAKANHRIACADNH